MAKLVDTDSLKHFLQRLYGIFCSKQDADNTYASKNGDYGNYFAASHVKVGSSDQNLAIQRYYENETNSTYLKVSNGTNNLLIPIDSNSSYAWTNSTFDPSSKVDVVAITLNATENNIDSDLTKFASVAPVCIFNTYSTGAVRIGTVYFLTSQQATAEGLTDGYGFYIKLPARFVFISIPNKQVLYYNATTSKLCKWVGSTFSNLSIGASGGTVVIDGVEYTVAEDEDIDEMIDNLLNE